MTYRNKNSSLPLKQLLLTALAVLMLGTAWADDVEDADAALAQKNYVTGLEKYKRAATNGDAYAQAQVGNMYSSGGFGVKQDYAEAVKWYKLAAAQGNVVAQSNLGFAYDNGQGVVQDYAEAVKWYRLAAIQGNVSAQYNLGVMYGNGRGVAQNYIRAHMWFNLAAVGGDADAVKNRDIVAGRMNTQQIAEAQEMAHTCQTQNFKGF